MSETADTRVVYNRDDIFTELKQKKYGEWLSKSSGDSVVLFASPEFMGFASPAPSLGSFSPSEVARPLPPPPTPPAVPLASRMGVSGELPGSPEICVAEISRRRRRASENYRDPD